MAIVDEAFAGRSTTIGRTKVTRITVNVHDAADEIDARDAVQLWRPATYDGMYAGDVDIDELGGGHWRATVVYSLAETDDEYTFDTGGGNQKITQSPVVASYAPSGATAPDFQGAINVSDDRVEGVDVVSPVFQFSETHRVTDTFVLAGYKQVLFGLTGCVNNATFKGLAAGECLFLGASGTKRGLDAWSITYRFAGSPNVTGLTIGDITGVDKLGWDYLWVRYADFPDSFAYCLVKRPIAAYVHRVYTPADFSDLGIGT